MYKIPTFDIDKNTSTWLRASWKFIRENAAKPEYRQLRHQTLGNVEASFDPKKIHRLLVTEEATTITLLGILHIEPESSVIKDAESIILFIKTQFQNGNTATSFSISSISEKIGLDPAYARVIFNLANEFAPLYSGASSKGPHRSSFDFDEYRIETDELYDSYLTFQSLFDRMSEYYQRVLYKENSAEAKSVRVGNDRAWLNQSGELSILDHMNKFGFGFVQTNFIDPSRIRDLMNLRKGRFDLLKLLNLCKEINFNYAYGNYYSVAMLTRALIDHIPPIFECKNFSEVANNYKSNGNVRSFQKSMSHLDVSLRSIGDSVIHSQIRPSEIEPTETQINFKNDLDLLLGGIVRVMRTV